MKIRNPNTVILILLLALFALLALNITTAAAKEFNTGDVWSVADSTGAHLVVAGGSVWTQPFKLHQPGRTPDAVTFSVATDEDSYATCDSTYLIVQYWYSLDGTNYVEWTAARDTVTTEDGDITKTYLKGAIPQAVLWKEKLIGKMAAGDSLNVEPDIAWEFD